MVDLRNIPTDESPKRLDNIEEEERRSQKSSKPLAVDLKHASLQAVAKSLQLTGAFTLPASDSKIDGAKSGGAFAKPKEALLLALSDLQCNDWEVGWANFASTCCHPLLSAQTSALKECIGRPWWKLWMLWGGLLPGTLAFFYLGWIIGHGRYSSAWDKVAFFLGRECSRKKAL